MLSKKFRLPILEVAHQKGRVVRGPYFTIKIFSSPRSFSRLSVIVSAKNSVERNRLRRRLFQAAELVLKQWPVADYLIIAQTRADRLSQKEINEWFISQNPS